MCRDDPCDPIQHVIAKLLLADNSFKTLSYTHLQYHIIDMI